MTPGPPTPEDLLARLRVLERENDLLTERAEEIALLGLVAEQVETTLDPAALLDSVLEQICILKAIPYGACLIAGAEGLLSADPAYHVRRTEEGPGLDRFQLREPGDWPPRRAQVLDAGEMAGLFENMEIGRPGLAARALALVPLRRGPDPDGCLAFADDRRSPAELAHLLPLLERVAELVQAQMVNLALIGALQELAGDLDRKVAERTRDLSRSEARYRILFEHVPDGILLVDADSAGTLGRIEDANEVAVALHGYTLEELRRMDLDALRGTGPGGPLEAFESRVWRLRPGETVREELQHRHKDGSTFPVEAIGTLVRVHEHQYLLGFFRDLRERKQAEQALLAAQRAESLGLLAGGIAHDFNNLLTAIMGQASLVLDREAPGFRHRDNLERILDAAERAATLTRQMLAYSGRGKFTLQPVQLNRLIRDNLRILEAAAPKQVAFALDLDPTIPPVVGDLSQLQQVIMNLVINGVEAIGTAPGRVSVRTRAEHLGEARGELAPGAYIAIEVADSGCGMDAQVRARMFEPFFTTKEKGHGLGLSAVQGIIRGHRGGLTVDSREGLGTTFRILLPAGDLELPLEPAPAVPAGTAAPRTVLAIDDEAYMLDVIRDSLEAAGHRALLAASGEAGLELLQAQGKGLDLVLLDLSMPGLGGLETLRRIRAADPGIPVVLTSGFAEEEAVAQLGGMALAGFLQKPYRARTLVDLVESLPGRAGH